MVTQYFPSDDSASYYAERAAALESMGGDFQTLLQELAPLLRKIENVHWTSRHDLSFCPSFSGTTVKTHEESCSDKN